MRTHPTPPRRHSLRRAAAGDAGTFVVEFVLWVPVLVLLLMLVVAAGRVVAAGSNATEAADTAARAASLRTTMDAATTAARTAATRSLADAGIACRTVQVQVTGTVAPGGLVTVRVSCTTPLGDLAIPGLPGAKTLTATASQPIDLTVARVQP